MTKCIQCISVSLQVKSENRKGKKRFFLCIFYKEDNIARSNFGMKKITWNENMNHNNNTHLKLIANRTRWNELIWKINGKLIFVDGSNIGFITFTACNFTFIYLIATFSSFFLAPNYALLHRIASHLMATWKSRFYMKHPVNWPNPRTNIHIFYK